MKKAVRACFADRGEAMRAIAELQQRGITDFDAFFRTEPIVDTRTDHNEPGAFGSTGWTSSPSMDAAPEWEWDDDGPRVTVEFTSGSQSCKIATMLGPRPQVSRQS